MLASWTNDLAVGFKDIDEQHAKFIEIVNELHDAAKEGKAKEKINEVIEFLGDYTVTHFATEEKLMDKYSYPDSAAHKAQHKAFIEVFKKFKSDLSSGKASLSLVLEIKTKIYDWLINHIKNTDKKFGAFLQGKN